MSTAVFYHLIEKKLYRDHTLKKYPRRIDCIIEKMREKESHDLIDAKIIYEMVKVEAEKISVRVQSPDVILLESKSIIEDTNFSCLMPGIVSVTILGSIMLIVISLVICLSKNENKRREV